MFKSSVGFNGLPDSPEVSGGNAYLYGLSDFWALMFEDTELVERMLEQHSIQMAEVYSTFLQLTSTISLEDVQAYTNSDLNLLTILGTADHIEGTTYQLPEGFVDCKYLLNRPILPTNTLENRVHFDIDPDNNTITFYDLLENAFVPSREKLDPETGILVDTEYALWATDVVTDEDLVFRYYGQYVGFTNEAPSTAEIYKNFIRGLYFLYVNGPVIRYMEQGLSLALGVPIARETETVLAVVKDADADSYIVVTANNSYTIPYDVEPDFDPTNPEKNTLLQGAALLKVATISDHINDPGWWNNVAIPFELVERFRGKQYGDATWYGDDLEPDAIINQIVASVDTNSSDDQQEMYFLMDTFLKHHSFLVKLTWQTTFEDKTQAEVLRLLDTAKPTYTYAIQIWDIPLGQEILTLIDDSDSHFQVSAENVYFDILGCGDEYIDRSISYGTWAATTDYSLREIVVPDYDVLGQESSTRQALCLTAGTTGGVEPDWESVDIDQTLVDGSVVWIVQEKEEGLNSERGYGCFIHSNFDPDDIIVDQVTTDMFILASNNFPDQAIDLVVSDSDLVPLFNASARETREKLSMMGVDFGYCLPDTLAISEFDGTEFYSKEVTTPERGTYTESLFLRDYQEYVDTYGLGFVGTGYNTESLGIPVDLGEAYRAYFPDTGDITVSESIIVRKVSTDMYSFFWLKPGGVVSFPKVFFELTPSDTLTVYTIPSTGTSIMSPAYAAVDVQYSNGNLTILGGGE